MKKLFVVLFLFVSFSVYAQHDTLVWAPLGTYTNIPVAAIYNDAVVLGDTLYAHINNDVNAAATFYKYYISDPTQVGGTWEVATSLPVAVAGGALVQCGGLLYYIGGSSAVNTSGSDVYSYSPLTGQWTSKAQLPTALSGHGAVSWGDSVILVMGGPWGTTTTTNLSIYYYRPATDTWGTISGASALPSGAGRRAFAIGIDENKIIIAGGYAGDYLNSAYVGTIGTDATDISWQQIDNIPSMYGFSRCGGTAINGHFFLVGGEKSSSAGYSDSTFVFNFTTNTWQYSFPGKPIATSNIFNSVASKMLSGDTAMIFTVGAYNGVSYATFDVAKFYSLLVSNIKEVKTKTLSAYPNPAINEINIECNIQNANGNIQIINVSGQIVDEFKFNNNLKINIRNYQAGLYTVRFKEYGVACKFIKQ